MRPSAALLEREPVEATARDQQLVAQLHAALEAADPSEFAARPARLITRNGETFEVPASVYGVLVRVLHELAAGNAVAVFAVHAQLTTQQAADLLGVSRPHLIKLLDVGEIAYSRPGARTHRRIRLADLMAYQDRHQQDRQAALDEVVVEGERLELAGKQMGSLDEYHRDRAGCRTGHGRRCRAGADRRTGCRLGLRCRRAPLRHTPAPRLRGPLPAAIGPLGHRALQHARRRGARPDVRQRDDTDRGSAQRPAVLGRGHRSPRPPRRQGQEHPDRPDRHPRPGRDRRGSPRRGRARRWLATGAAQPVQVVPRRGRRRPRPNPGSARRAGTARTGARGGMGCVLVAHRGAHLRGQRPRLGSLPPPPSGQGRGARRRPPVRQGPSAGGVASRRLRPTAGRDRARRRRFASGRRRRPRPQRRGWLRGAGVHVAALLLGVGLHPGPHVCGGLDAGGARLLRRRLPGSRSGLRRLGAGALGRGLGRPAPAATQRVRRRRRCGDRAGRGAQAGLDRVSLLRRHGSGAGRVRPGGSARRTGGAGGVPVEYPQGADPHPPPVRLHGRPGHRRTAGGGGYARAHNPRPPAGHAVPGSELRQSDAHRVRPRPHEASRRLLEVSRSCAVWTGPGRWTPAAAGSSR